MFKATLFRSLLALVMLMPISNVMSEDISFDYAQFSYISSTVDPGASLEDVDGNGIGLTVSLSFRPAFAMRLSVAATTFENYQGEEVDTSKATALGVTAHTSVADATEIFTNLSVVKAAITAAGNAGSESDIGGLLEVGLRHKVIDALELEVRATHVNVFNDTVNTYVIDARYFVRRTVSFGIAYADSDEVSSLIFKIRIDV